jgi:hypothetical protein
MTTTYSLTTDIGKIRLIIQDKDIANAFFTDEEIQVFLTFEGSVNCGAAACLESWAAAYGTNADNEKIGDYSYGQNIVTKMLSLAAKLRENAIAAITPAMAWAEMYLNDEDNEETE